MTSASTKPRRSAVRRLAVLGGPSTRPISGRRWFPLYGVLHHIGRRSGREYATPVVVRSTAEGTWVPLPFGESTDWYRNARAAGGLRVTWRGRDHWLADPTVVSREAANGAFNGLMRTLMRVAGIEFVVRFEPIAKDDRR
jgi:deazaflavin-dependent oxidoreductase (nitroreductase family)